MSEATLASATLALAVVLWAATGPRAEAGGRELGRGPVFGVVEIDFAGPHCKPADAPARDIELRATFIHEDRRHGHAVYGFWDGDGKGGSEGSVFKVRFCPTAPGRWVLLDVKSNHPRLASQHKGGHILATPSQHKGFWTPDPATPGGRWYRRSDGSHPYIFGNTHYTFLSGRNDRGPNGSTIEADIRANARFFAKLRFGLCGGRYPHPTEKPFLDDAGQPTDDGDFSHRPNPAWFHNRPDDAVRTAWEVDLIADIILNGPDTRHSRSVLRAARNRGDNTPFLRYVAARYGSYPNVWFCLANEWDIKNPKYTAEQIAAAGVALRRCLATPAPISVHASRDWSPKLNARPPWNDHVILQHKIRHLAPSADAIMKNHRLGGADRPVVNDELGYEGAGDRFTRDDVIAGHLGAFLGGGYGTTGSKPANKKGHYFWGAFDPAEHTAAKHLAWLRRIIDTHIAFWKMAPVAPREAGFSGVPAGARAMAWPGHEIVLGTGEAAKGMEVRLPAGAWHIQRFDAIAMQTTILEKRATGTVALAAPASRAVLFHLKKIEE